MNFLIFFVAAAALILTVTARLWQRRTDLDQETSATGATARALAYDFSRQLAEAKAPPPQPEPMPAEGFSSEQPLWEQPPPLPPPLTPPDVLEEAKEILEQLRVRSALVTDTSGKPLSRYPKGDATDPSALDAEFGERNGEAHWIDEKNAVLWHRLPLRQGADAVLYVGFDLGALLAGLYSHDFRVFTVALVMVSLMCFLLLRVVARVINPLTELRGAAEQLAAGDFRLHLQADGYDEIARLSEAFNDMAAQLGHLIRQIHEAAINLSTSTTEISATTEELARGAENQSHQTAEMAGAVEELASSVQLIFVNARNSHEASRNANTMAEEGGTVVRDTIDQMEHVSRAVERTAGEIGELARMSEDIGKIVDVIREIAGQTNLLALNAAIEAARAGEHGRGFEVVAEEIRKLAEKSAHSTSEITTILEAIHSFAGRGRASMDEVRESVTGATRMATQTGQSLQAILGSSSETAEMMGALSEAAEQQARVSDQVAGTVTNISTITRSNATSAEEIAGTAVELSRLAERLQTLVRQFKLPD